MDKTELNLNEQICRARERSTRPMVTEESIRAGEVFIEEARKNEVKSLRKKIEEKELIPLGQVQKRLEISPKEIAEAVNQNRLFSISGPDGIDYYPAFYTETQHDRQHIEQVISRLGSLPATLKYHFFISKRISLRGKTPLESLAEGRLNDVLRAATEYAER